MRKSLAFVFTLLASVAWAAGTAPVLKPSSGGAGVFTPQMYNPTAGTGGDDSAAINAALNAAVGAVGFGRVFLPTPPSGYYNVCASSVLIPDYNIALDIGGPLAGQGAIRILPGCASPPSAVFAKTMNSPWASTGRVHLHDLTIDGYCVAKYDLSIGSAVGFTVDHVILRNVASSSVIPGSANLYVGTGYENEFANGVRLENINDNGHTCYTSAGALPSYNLITYGSDSLYSGIVGIGAKTNFFNAAGGNNHFRAAHGWGYTAAAEPTGVDLRSQYTFQCNGNCDIQGSVMDSSTVAGIALHAFSGDNSGAVIMGNTLMGIDWSLTGYVGIQIDDSLLSISVIGNNLSATPPSGTAIVQLGTPGWHTFVFGNINASYQTALPGPLPSLSVGTASGAQLSFNNYGVSVTGVASQNLYLAAAGQASINLQSGGANAFTAYAPVSAVNNVQAASAAASFSPQLSAVGSDTDIGLTLSGKGAGAVAINASLIAAPGVTGGDTMSATGYSSGNGASLIVNSAGNGNLYLGAAGTGAITLQSGGSSAFSAYAPVTAVNFLQASSAQSGFSPQLSAVGAGTNLDVILVPKGTGHLKAGNAASWTANGAVATTMTSLGPAGSHATVQEWFTVVNSSGVTRYIPAY